MYLAFIGFFSGTLLESDYKTLESSKKQKTKNKNQINLKMQFRKIREHYWILKFWSLNFI